MLRALRPFLELLSFMVTWAVALLCVGLVPMYVFLKLLARAGVR